MDAGPPVERIEVTACTVPTDGQESDGTLTWDSTTIVIVQAHASGHTGIGWTYTDAAAAGLVRSKLADVVVGSDALSVGDSWVAMAAKVRNVSRPGLAMFAISAVDIALWDLKARLLGVGMTTALDKVHDRVPIYGSGGFTSYDEPRLCEQLASWVADGIPRVKMKVGRDPAVDPSRVAAARRAIGDDAALFVDANGAWSAKQAVRQAERLAEFDVSWLEEPVTSEDLDGLRLVRRRAPAQMDIAAGEYGDVLDTFRRMLAAGAVDCLQADVTRCGGFTGFRRVAALCEAHHLDLSAHCAPGLGLEIKGAVLERYAV